LMIQLPELRLRITGCCTIFLAKWMLLRVVSHESNARKDQRIDVETAPGTTFLITERDMQPIQAHLRHFAGVCGPETRINTGSRFENAINLVSG